MTILTCFARSPELFGWSQKRGSAPRYGLGTSAIALPKIPFVSSRPFYKRALKKALFVYLPLAQFDSADEED